MALLVKNSRSERIKTLLKYPIEMSSSFMSYYINALLLYSYYINALLLY